MALDPAERSSRFGLKLVGALVAACALGLSLPVTAWAGNFGAGATNESYRCLNFGQTGFKNSECITDTYNWNVWIDPDIPNGLETAFRASVTDDYDSITGFLGTNQTAVNSETDVRIIEAQIENDYPYAIYTTCEAGATEGGGTGYYRWCKDALIVFDNSHPDTNDVLGNKPWYACHELGHTTGLAHYTGEVSRFTCMDYGDPNATNLHAHDVEHLQDCYPIPAPNPPYDLTAGCYIEGVH